MKTPFSLFAVSMAALPLAMLCAACNSYPSESSSGTKEGSSAITAAAPEGASTKAIVSGPVVSKEIVDALQAAIVAAKYEK